MAEIIGRLERLRRYPVKSMAGEDLESVYISENGIVGDRLCGYRLSGVESDFVSRRYLTARNAPELLLCRPSIADEPSRSEAYPESYRPRIEIELPEIFGLNKIVGVEDSQLIKFLEEHYGVSLQVDYQKGIFDQKAISLVGMPSLEALKVDPLRFRENMYISWDKEPLYEDSLVGKVIRIGDEVRVSIDEQCKRCVMVNIDPNSAEKDNSVLKAIGSYNKARLGVYGSVLQQGIVREGDAIYLE